VVDGGELGEVALRADFRADDGSRRRASRVGLTGLTVAEYFRDEEHLDVLLLHHNIFDSCRRDLKFPRCWPHAFCGGYQPNLNTEIGELQERITSTKTGSITSVQAIYVAGGRLH